MTTLSVISFVVRAGTTIWGSYLLWRVRDWRLAFLLAILAILMITSLQPGLGEAKSPMLQVSILTVVVVSVLHFLFHDLRRRTQMRGVRVLTILIVLYQMTYLLKGETFAGPVTAHTELSISLLSLLAVALLECVLTERQQVQKRIRDDALRDSLTGLPNRTVFLEKLARAQSRVELRPDYLFSVLLVDLDRFKLLNETLGSTAGDLFLVQTARRLQSAVRRSDTVARLGGDEFAVLLENLYHGSQAEEVAKRLLAQLAVPHPLDKKELFTSASIGIVLSSGRYHRPEDLLRDADTAMYRAKQHGKGGYAVFDQEMHQDVKFRLELEADLRGALERGELLLHYQAVVEIERRKPLACEALLRWNHPKRGFICPAEFIPVAEETGMILPIGEWILRTACTQNQAWQQEGLSPVRVSVNVSPLQLRHSSFPQAIRRILEETGLRSNLLELEIKEAIFVEDSGFVRARLNELKDLGVRLAVDDLGTGHSSISYLRRYPLDAVKIDASLITALTKGERGTAEIVSALIGLANDLNLDVIAVGVESEDQVRFLRSRQCRLAQGFLFSRPRASQSFTKLLQGKHLTAKGSPATGRPEHKPLPSHP